jgi:hypothetical protein
MRALVSRREDVRATPPELRITARRNGVPVEGRERESLPVLSFQFHRR